MTDWCLTRVRRFAGSAPFAVLLALLACLPLGADATDADAEIYVRDLGTVQKALARLAAEAKRAKVAEVLVAFDRITFHPPPGRSEYRYDHDFARDLEAWLEGIGAWVKESGVVVRATCTGAKEAVCVGDGDWKGDLRREIERDWWSDASFARFRPALEWIQRLAPKGRTRRKPGLVVLVASEWTPERWADPSAGDASAAGWRRKLLPVGKYWDEEAIGLFLARSRCPLTVVTPEVRFGHEHPLPTRPALPWASRPQRPPPDLYGSYGADEDEAYDAMLREDLERDLKAEIPDPIERRKRIDEILGKGDEGRAGGGGDAREGTTSVPDDGRTTDDDVPSGAGRGGRFTSGPPSLFPRFGGAVLFQNDVPSGFAWWPYARAAARSDGRCFLYPFGPSNWRDVCPRDDRILDRLAPMLPRRDLLVSRRKGDRALAAMCRATSLVLGETPWVDQGNGQVARGWSAFTSASPVARTSGWRARRFPSDLFVIGQASALRAQAPRLERLVKRHDQAMAILDAAIAEAKPGQKGWSRRTVADLYLARFLFAQSAFHLAEVAHASREFERLIPKGWDRVNDDYILSHLPFIRMSDCVDAYDGRMLEPDSESHYPRALHRAWIPPGFADRPGRWEPGQIVPGQTGNVLKISPASNEYRAKRDIDAVVKHFDEKLQARARDLIAAGRAVMRDYAKTPWGWTVYYTEVQGFVYDPVDGDLDVRPRTGEDTDRPDVPFSPTRPGSGPGGPTSGR